MESRRWQEDWPIRVYERVNQLGFYSLSAFMDSKPMASSVTLAAELGPDVAGVQLESLWFGEAEEQRRLAPALTSLLIRSIRRSLPQGWGTADEFRSALSLGVVAWGHMADRYLPEPEIDRVWDFLCAMTPPAGWLPVVPHDEWTSRLHLAIEEALSRSQSIETETT